MQWLIKRRQGKKNNNTIDSNSNPGLLFVRFGGVREMSVTLHEHATHRTSGCSTVDSLYHARARSMAAGRAR